MESLPELPENYATALRLIDEAHARDERRDASGEVPYELHYARKMTRWLSVRCPNASPALQLACRAQHFRRQVPILYPFHSRNPCYAAIESNDAGRWEIPRSSYPMTRPGYLTWRAKLKSQAAEQVTELLSAASSIQPPLPGDEIEKIAALVRKEGLSKNEETQVLEDVACLVFLDDQFDDFEKNSDLSEEKMLGILRKTWAKMTDEGHALALTMDHSEKAKTLIGKALQE